MLNWDFQADTRIQHAESILSSLVYRGHGEYSSLVEPRPGEYSSIVEPRPGEYSSLVEPRPGEYSSLVEPRPGEYSSLVKPRPVEEISSRLNERSRKTRIKGLAPGLYSLPPTVCQGILLN